MIETTRGSDLTFNMVWSNGSPIDLTNYDVEFLDVDPALQDRITYTFLDPTQGEIEVQIEGTDPVTVGKRSFRVQITSPSGDSIATPLITVRYK